MSGAKKPQASPTQVKILHIGKMNISQTHSKSYTDWGEEQY
jgi:hypothetical protein